MLGCDHHTTLIQSSHGSGRSESIDICRRCGEIQIRATKSGVHFTTHFSLVSAYLLIAASHALRRWNDPDEPDLLTEKVWKPLDFAHLRLYQVKLFWRRKDGKHGCETYVVTADSPNQSANSAANQIKRIYQESYDLNEEIQWWHVDGAALNVLQPVEWTRNGINVLIDAFVPGEFVCPECGGRAAQKDESGTDATCPADNAMMLPMTWRQAAEEAGAIAQRHKTRAEALEHAWPDGYPMPIDEEFAENEMLT